MYRPDTSGREALAEWSEEEVWDYVRENDVPTHALGKCGRQFQRSDGTEQVGFVQGQSQCLLHFREAKISKCHARKSTCFRRVLGGPRELQVEES